MAAERIFEILDEAEMNDEPSGLPVKEQTPYKVSFENVQFGYDDKQLLMNDFSLDVEPGEMVAIVGPTGAGKTTLINLLERFYDISGGSIRYNGKDTRDYSREELRSHFSMVLQDTWLFTGTIYDNILYGNEHATREQVIAAATAAHVDEFVRKLPNGYDTVLGEGGVNLSGGQKQRLSIARTLAKNSEVILFDEATSALDTAVENQIVKEIEQLQGDKTMIFTAHRLSTVWDFDIIFVLADGRLVGQGRAEELLQSCPTFAKLAEHQVVGQLATGTAS